MWWDPGIPSHLFWCFEIILTMHLHQFLVLFLLLRLLEYHSSSCTSLVWIHLVYYIITSVGVRLILYIYWCILSVYYTLKFWVSAGQYHVLFCRVGTLYFSPLCDIAAYIAWMGFWNWMCSPCKGLAILILLYRRHRWLIFTAGNCCVSQFHGIIHIGSS